MGTKRAARHYPLLSLIRGPTQPLQLHHGVSAPPYKRTAKGIKKARMRRIRRTLSPSDIKLSTAKIRKISIPPNFSAEKFKKYPEKHNPLPYKYRASESRAKLVPAMPSEADIQYSTRIKFTKILPHTQPFRFLFYLILRFISRTLPITSQYTCPNVY